MVAADQLKAFVERIERLEEEKKAIADDIRDIYAEAKGTGFDVKAIRTIVRLRKQDANERKEHEAVLETYMHALGMLFDTPLGQAATERATAAADKGRTDRAPRRTRESMDDLTAFAKDAAEKGLISQDAAAETEKIAEGIKKKFGGTQVDLEEAISEKAQKAAASPEVQRAVKKLGTPVPLTEEEKAQGYSAAFVKNGTRMAMHVGGGDG